MLNQPAASPTAPVTTVKRALVASPPNTAPESGNSHPSRTGPNPDASVVAPRQIAMMLTVAVDIPLTAARALAGVISTNPHDAKETTARMAATAGAVTDR